MTISNHCDDYIDNIEEQYPILDSCTMNAGGMRKRKDEHSTSEKRVRSHGKEEEDELRYYSHDEKERTLSCIQSR